MERNQNIHTVGSIALRKKAEDVMLVDQEIKNIVRSMLETMYNASGIGLAAPQVGISKKIFVIDPDWHKDNEKNPTVFINPAILSISTDLCSMEEGCLSVPGIYTKIYRPKSLRMSAKGLSGETFTIDASGVLARVIQHEYDHLLGVLMIDRMGFWEKLKNRKRLKKYIT